MCLNDIAVVAGDTSRSRAYLQAMVRHQLLPNFVLVLGHGVNSPLPGQSMPGHKNSDAKEVDNCWSESHFDPTQPIEVLLNESGIAHEFFESKDINDPLIVDILRRRPETTFIYSGFGGALLRKDVLSIGKHFLHVHGGYLPDFKGSTTNYYSLIAENALGASAIFLSEEIDCGPVLHRKKFLPPENRREIDHIYDSAARSKVLVETLQNYLKSGDKWQFELPSNIGGETYYIIHPVLKHVAILGKG